MKKINIVVFLISIVFTGTLYSTATAQSTVSAVDTSDRTADHNILRGMLKDAEKAINEGRFNDLSKYLDPNVNVIYQNAEVADGTAAVQAFQERILNANGGVLKSVQTKVTADKLTEFYGNTAIAYGTAVDQYTFVGGLEMEVTSKWSTTLIKQNGEWKVVSVQFTTNLFDNPLLTNAKSAQMYFGLGGFVAGVLLVLILCKVMGRRKKV